MMSKKLDLPNAEAAKELLLSGLQDAMETDGSVEEVCRVAAASNAGLGLAMLAVVDELKAIREHLTGVNGE